MAHEKEKLEAPDKFFSWSNSAICSEFTVVAMKAIDLERSDAEFENIKYKKV